MHHDYDLLVVGGGMAADAVATGYRAQGGTGTIGILSADTDAPYARPPLSKDLWGDGPGELADPADAALGTADATGATLHLGDAAAGLDVEAKQVATEGGETFGYGTLVVATGGDPRRLSGLEDSDRVVHFRRLEDFRRLGAAVADKPSVVVVGSGFIGTELAAALTKHECPVTLVHPGDVVGDHAFPREIADRLESAFVERGVTVRGGVRVEGGTATDDGVSLALSDGSSLEADLAVVGLGIEPSVGWLAGVLEIADDGGIRVDEHLATSAPDVYAAGDCASYVDPRLGRRRVEHEDAAVSMGKAAGRIAAGSDETFDSTPMFYSDVFDLGYEAVGDLTTQLETYVEDVPGDDGQAYVFYADDDVVRGVLLWAFAPGLEAATELVGSKRPADLADLRGTVS